MGWAHCGTDDDGREIGYGVRALCDFPGCGAEIDRGLGYVCGTMHGSVNGCGRYFCPAHLTVAGGNQRCLTCAEGVEEDDSPCPPGNHQWKTQLISTPDVYERVCYCDVCGAEKGEDD